MIRSLVRYLDRRTGTAPALKRALRYVFPDHWTFLFGEIALYAFIVLVVTGVYLTFFFEPSLAQTTYEGSYEPLRGARMSDAYRSVVDLSLDTRAGLLIRQTHHWAALVFVAAIAVHLMRIFFTGAFRSPRDVNYYVGVTMLALALMEGFAGYSLVDDLLSGMGLAIAYSVLMSVPFVGANLAVGIWGGQFPGSDAFMSRLYIGHVLLLPVLIGTLMALHLLLITRPHHTQFRGPGRREGNTVGSRMWPGYALRSAGLLFAVAAVLVLLGGLIQINPIWQWGPYDISASTNGAQPDWYLGWLIGALRLMPGVELTLGDLTVLPNPFFGGVLFPGVVFGVLYLWPLFERLVTGDGRPHHLLDRPRDAPWRTAFGAAFFTWILVVFLAGAADQAFVHFDIPYQQQVTFFRIAAVVLPLIVFWCTKRICDDLRDSGAHPLRGWTGRVVRRGPTGGFETRDERDTG